MLCRLLNLSAHTSFSSVEKAPHGPGRCLFNHNARREAPATVAVLLHALALDLDQILGDLDLLCFVQRSRSSTHYFLPL
jgi:hypothetical protein